MAGPGSDAVSEAAQAEFAHTGIESIDRELNALWISFNATGDERVMQLITDTYFRAANP